MTPLVRLDKGDLLLSIDSKEVNTLTCPGCGWVESCNPYNGGDGTPDWCQDDPGTALKKHSAMQGPFVIHSSGCGLQKGDPILPQRVPLIRCVDSSSKIHTLVAGNGATCQTPFVFEIGLGCLNDIRSSNIT